MVARWPAIVSDKGVLLMAEMKHGDRPSRKFRHAVRMTRQHMPAGLPAGFFLTDPVRTPDPVSTIRGLPVGVGVIFRHFGQEAALSKAPDIVRLCQRQNRKILVGADIELAIAIGADGVHWPARLAHKIPGSVRHVRLNTLSVHSVTELRRARTVGADAILVSAVYPSESPSAGAPIGPGRLRSLARTAGRPVYALGGITCDNVERIARTSGFAAISGLKEAAG